MEHISVLGLCGALRQESSNRKLLNEAVRLLAPAEYTEGGLDLPLFNEDIQNGPGIPSSVQTLADQIAAADAVIISTPEYNKAIPGVLKNALDWVSRTEGTPWSGKPVAVMSAAAGRAGGERSQQMLRWCLNPFRPRVIAGPEMHLADSRNQFDEAGRLINERSEKLLSALMDALRAEIALARGGAD